MIQQNLNVRSHATSETQRKEIIVMQTKLESNNLKYGIAISLTK